MCFSLLKLWLTLKNKNLSNCLLVDNFGYKQIEEVTPAFSSTALVLHMNFSFSDILKIDNLWEFTSLVKLQLDNNIIEKIEGLDLLVNLVWLGKSLVYSIKSF